MPPLVEVKNLSKTFKRLKALENITLNIEQGETLGLVGESGCGKSTLGKLLLRLEEKTAGDVFFSRQDIFQFSPATLKAWRKKAQPIFQDPTASLNPRMQIEAILKEPFQIHHIPLTARRLEELFSQVALPLHVRTRLPSELSSGQRQRVSIARALSLHPQFLVCDEAIASLDVSTQAQIVTLLTELQKTLDLTYLFISHDLRMIAHISTRIAVLYLGSLVELAPTSQLIRSPLHPYTQALLSAIPLPDPILEKRRTKIFLSGEPPSPLNPPQGCKFCTRCPKVMDICRQVRPALREVLPGHQVACHLF